MEVRMLSLSAMLAVAQWELLMGLAAGRRAALIQQVLKLKPHPDRAEHKGD